MKKVNKIEKQGALALTPQDAYTSLKTTLKTMEPEIIRALPRHVPVESWVRTLLTLVQKTPTLLNCTQHSFLGAMMTCAERGLVPGYEAHIIPFRNSTRGCTEANVIFDYKGLIKLMINSGAASSVKADVVRIGDDFDDHGEKIYHKKNLEFSEVRDSGGGCLYVVPKEQQPIWAVYCEIKLKDGSYQHRTLTMDEVEAARNHSRDPNGIWKKHFIEMAKKTSVRRIAKYVPQSPELIRALELEDLHEEGRSQGLASIVDPTYIPAFESEEATTVKKVNEEGFKKNDANQKNELLEQIERQIVALQQIGFKDKEISKTLGVSGYDEINEMVSDRLTAILETLIDMEKNS